MKFLKRLTTFFPWIAYTILSSFSPAIAMLAAVIISLCSYSKLRKGFILEWSSLLFFTAGFINAIIFKNQWFTENMSFLISGFFVAVVVFSLLINKPFTMQYAKLDIEKKYWDSLVFLRINQIMTGALGGIFLVITLINLYRHSHPGIINGYLVWGIALPMKMLFISRFPEWYKKRYLRKLAAKKEFFNENHSD